MFVNSIDLHNNLKNELVRIRQGQTCFSVCHDARSMSLIRVVGETGEGRRLGGEAVTAGAPLSTPLGLSLLMKAAFH